MSVPGSIVQAQAEALLRLLAREQEIQTRRARDVAEAQGRSLVARAREEAGARTRAAAQEARAALERALQERRAALDTATRRREQALLRGLLDEAWSALPGALAGVWQEAASRRAWCEAAADFARRTLLGSGAYTVELDALAPDDAADTALRPLRAEGSDGALLDPKADLGPGLRIRRGLACVDATLPGLLASRDRVEAELLAELEALLAPQPVRHA
jgi:hypothetical protein